MTNKTKSCNGSKIKNYHGKKVNLDRLEIVYIDDVSTKMMEYEQGNIDMCDLDTSLLDQI